MKKYYNDYYIKNMLEDKSSIAHMGEIVTSTKEKPIVGTMGLATCNGIIFYDRKNKKAWVGHGPASSSMTTLITMFNTVKKEVIGDLEYGIIPGWDNIYNHNLKAFDEMLDFLRRNCPKNIRLIPMADLDIRQDNRANPSYEFAFNAETGKSVTYDLFYEDDFLLSKKDDDSILYSGYSAGICVLANNLNGLNLVDNQEIDPYNSGIVSMNGVGIIDYLPVPHYKSDHPESPATDNVVKYLNENGLNYRTLQDGKAIVESTIKIDDTKNIRKS